MSRRSLLAQVLAVSLPLVAGTVLVATVALDVHLTNLDQGREMFVLGLAAGSRAVRCSRRRSASAGGSRRICTTRSTRP